MNGLGIKRLEFLKAIGYKYVTSDALGSVCASYESIDALNKDVRECSLCHLRNSAKSSMLGRGDEQKGVVFILLSPSKFDDESGQIFTNEEWFCELIKQACGLKTDEFYTTFLLKCVAQKAEKSHISQCAPYLFEELRLLNPRAIVTLGGVVFSSFFPHIKNLNSVRGSFFKFSNALLMPTFSPEWLAKNPSAKDDFIADISKIKGLI